jgi:branched-chain amino acid transport system substrate-binding protein
MSGFVAPYDEGPLKGAQLAISDINARGGLFGRPLTMVTADTKSDPAQGTNAAIEVLEQGAEFVMVTCDFDYGAAAAIAAQAAGKVTFSSCAADPKFGVQGIGPFAYTMSLGTPAQATVLAEFAYREKGWRNAYVIMDTIVEYFKSLCANFKIRWQELGGTIVGEDVFHGINDTAFDGHVTRLKNNSDADMVFLCGATFGAPSLLRQIRTGGIDTPAVASESMDGAFWLEAVPNLSNYWISAYGSIHGNDPNPKIQDFMDRFEAMHGAPPVTAHALTGYSLIEAWVLAAERAGSLDGDAIRAELDKLDKEPLLIGDITYTPDLHVNLHRQMLIMEVQNGQFTPIGRYTPDQVPPIKF